ncbi:hypothetical protein WIS52_30135 [Pseudonocardia nematodicida]|uniref:DivIVA domain-containing protein n=1 Tax=Pseudonocardia nematodicida TaxID=1206997 RepID=A0ABV1KL95_9PSEU
MSASPSPSSSGPERPDPVHGGVSRHSRRAAAPDRGTPEDGAWFTVVLRGYDRAEVDTRLTDLDRRIHDEIRRAESAESALSAARAHVRRLQEQVEAATTERGGDAGFGRRVERVLQAAEQEAAELRDRATAEAEEIVERARAEADERRTRTEEALLGRAATLDREFTARSTAMDERETAVDRREQDLDDREQGVEKRVRVAVEEADRIVVAARTDADDVLTAARDEATAVRRDAERDAADRRAGVVRDVERLAALRDEVRTELTRVQRTLSAELAREPVSAALDDALFGPSPASRAEAEPGDTGAVATVSTLTPARGSATRSARAPQDGAGTDRTAEGRGTRPDTADRSGPAVDAGDPAGDSRDDSPAGGDRDTPPGTLLAGPGRRDATASGGSADEDPENTTIGYIPPVSLTSIGVLPFGELGTGRDNARTRTDGVNGASRTHRGPTRGTGPGRRSR